jgi:Bifunctional DNA primase/polymerase, N-terminal
MTAAEKLSAAPDAPILEFALDYARRGWPVFPCKPTNKAPYVNGGFNAATTDEETIRSWWITWPRAMIGVPMGSRSGVWAVDPDPPKKPEEPDGRAIWAGLLRDHGKLPATHTEVTPRGGWHILFKWDPDRLVTDSPGALARTNIDVRGEGGYVIMAPSICFGDGSAKNVAGQYCVVEPLDFFNFAMAPDWLYDLVLAKPKEKTPTAAAATPLHQQPRISSLFPKEKNEFWRKVNTLAFDKLDNWVPDIFGNAAEYQPKTGGLSNFVPQSRARSRRRPIH